MTASPAGLSGRQLGEILGLSPQSFLHHSRECSGIYREKHDGVFIYFSDVDDICVKQIQQRSFLICQSAIITISDIEAIMILVAIIRQHDISAKEILALSEIKKSGMKLSEIKGFMEYHYDGKIQLNFILQHE